MTVRTYSRYQLNARLRASMAAAVKTWGSLKRVGGNINEPAQYVQSPLFANAVFNSAGFTDTGSGPTPLNSSGWPSTGGWFCVVSAALNATNTAQQPNLKSGQLTLSTYTNCMYKTPSGTPATLSATGGTISALNLQSDDGTTKTYTFTLSVVSQSNTSIQGTQAISYLWIPLDGSSAYSSSAPIFSSIALAYYSQFATMRLMNLVETLSADGGLGGAGRYSETTWSGTYSGRIPNKTMLSRPESWETVFAFVKALDAYSGGATKSWVNLPGFTDTNYAVQCATLANTLGVPAMYIEPANEVWNSGNYYYGHYQYLGIQEAQVLTTYGFGTFLTGLSGSNAAGKITSVTSDASRNVTVTTSVDPTTLVPLIAVGTQLTGYMWAGGTIVSVWNPNHSTITAVTSSSFTYSTTTAPVSSTLTQVTSLRMLFTQPNYIASVTTDSASPVNVTVTLTVPISTFSWISAGQKLVATGLTGGGSLASPCTIASTTTNSFTYASPGATPSTTYAGAYAVFIGQVASSGVGLDSDLIKGSGGGLGDFNVFNLAYYYFTRQVKRMRDAWVAVRPQDKFVLSVQTFGGTNPGNSFSPAIHFKFAKYLGNLAGSTTPDLTWLEAVATAPYVSTNGSSVDDTFNQLNTNFTLTQWKADANVFWCRYYGVRPFAYEWGPDTSAMSSLQVEIQTDARMPTFVHSLGSMLLKAGFEVTNYFQVTPSQWIENSGNSCWSSQQTFADVWTNGKTQALLSLQNDAESYANYNGTCPCTFPVDNSKMNDGATFNRTGIITAFGTLTGGSGYVDGTYLAVPMGGGPWNTAGNNVLLIGALQAKAKIVVSGGVVVSVDLTGAGDTGGTGYAVGQVLGCPASSLGGTGTGFSVLVGAVSTNSALGAGIAAFPSSGTRDIYWLGSANAAGTFTFSAIGTDSAANTAMSVYIDNVLQGTVTLPQGGAANSPATCTPATTTTLSVTVPKGPFILKTAFLSGGSSPGITRAALA